MQFTYRKSMRLYLQIDFPNVGPIAKDRASTSGRDTHPTSGLGIRQVAASTILSLPVFSDLECTHRVYILFFTLWLPPECNHPMERTAPTVNLGVSEQILMTVLEAYTFVCIVPIQFRDFYVCP